MTIRLLFAQSEIESTQIVPGELIWGAPAWVMPAAVLAGCLAILVFWNYGRAAKTSFGWLAAAFKLVAIALLAFCLLQPMRSGQRPRPQANVLSILADNSQSMQLKPTGETETRGQRITRLLDEQNQWRVRLAQAFDVRSYAFDARLERMESTDELSMDGYVSSMFGSFQSLSDRLAGRPMAGAMLFTDGNLTDLPADFDWSSLGFPIYPVLPAKDQEIRDLRIAGLTVRQTDFESAPTTLRVQVDSTGLGGDNTVVQLRDESGEIVEEQTINLAKDETNREVTFRFRPENAGINFFRLTTFNETDRRIFEELDADLQSSEATEINNQRIVVVDRSTGPYRVLYVAGRPNWEFKFLRRALQEDAEVQLVGLLRIANKEPKFSFRDQGVSSTNPLFQGLGDDEEETAQQYDQPVIIRLGVKESEELSEGFPESAEELFGYHGVILDDIEPEFFTQDQMLILRRFVSTRGGGLLMLGGQESFSGKDFATSPLGELSPVYGPSLTAKMKSGAYRLSITREGLLQPWVRLRENESAENKRVNEMPAFTTVNAVGDIKPGASLLSTVKSIDGPIVPALVAHRFGKGRAAAMPIGDFWRWSMRRGEDSSDDPAQFWRQTTRWLVNEVPRRAEVRVQAGADPSQPVSIIAHARDESYLPLDNAKVELEITRTGDKPFTITAEPDESLPGVYQAKFWSREPGGYRVNAKITSADGAEVGEASSGWAVQTGVAEFADLKINRQLLERIAKETGGEVIRDDELDKFAADLPNKKIPVTETWVYPIWHHPWILLTAVVCLCLEWGLRRWKGLP